MIKKEIKLGMILLYAGTAAMGGLLFGFDIAIITGAGPFLTGTFELNSLQEGWAYSSLLFGAILGAAVAGRMTDKWGRKRILQFVALVFALTSFWSALAGGITSLVLARIVGGLAVGAVSTVSPIFISEISPSKYRGSLVSMYQLFIVTGILISYLINYLLHDTGENNWRWMFGTGAIPSILFLGMLFLIPETPRYLFLKGEKAKAFEVLKRMGGSDIATEEIQNIKKNMGKARASFRMLLHPSLRKVLIVGFIMAILIQLSGINTIIDYAPKIFASAGWGIDTGLFATFGLGIVNFICTVISMFIIDRFGRRPMYIIGSIGLTLALTGLAIAGLTNQFSGLLVILLVFVFLIFFATFIGPVFWTYMSEIFPNWIRGTAMSVPTFTQWIFNALIVLLFPAMLSNLKPGISFGILAIFALLQLLFSMKYMKETRGKTLERIEADWTDN